MGVGAKPPRGTQHQKTTTPPTQEETRNVARQAQHRPEAYHP